MLSVLSSPELLRRDTQAWPLSLRVEMSVARADAGLPVHRVSTTNIRVVFDMIIHVFASILHQALNRLRFYLICSEKFKCLGFLKIECKQNVA